MVEDDFNDETLNETMKRIKVEHGNRHYHNDDIWTTAEPVPVADFIEEDEMAI